MVYPFIQAMEAGGLVSYGADIADLTRLAGKYIESRGREGANQILAFDPSRRHHLPSSGRLRQVRWRIERAAGALLSIAT
jgi:hypothetical protein